MSDTNVEEQVNEPVLDEEDQFLAEAGVDLDIGVEEGVTDEPAAVETTPQTSEPIAEGVPETQSQPEPIDNNSEGRGTQRPDYLQQFAQGSLPQDAQGNLVNPNNPTEIVAHAGAERHYFEQARNAKGFVGKLEARLNEVTTLGKQFETQVNTYKEMNNYAQQHGIEPQEQQTAMQLMASYKSNPIEALKYMLTDAQANGIDLSELLGDNSINTGAISQLIDTKLAPITQQQTQAAETQRAEAEATEQATQFLQQFPDAGIHTGYLAKIIEASEGKTSPREAYYQLREWTTRQGLDWSKPLLEQRVEQQNRNAPVNGQQRQQSLPSGRRSAAPVSGVNNASLSSDASTGDIVREAMLDAGLNFN